MPETIADAPALTWSVESARLKYMLGEIRLGAIEFPALVLQNHFSELIGRNGEPEPPFERFSDAGPIAVVKAPSYPIGEPMPRLRLLPWAIRYVPRQYRRHYVLLQGTFEEYLGKFSSKSRANLRKKVRKFEERSGGSIDWRTYRGRDPLLEFHRLAFPLSESTYQARLFGSGLPKLESFTRDLERVGDARGYLLFLDGRPIAYLFCPTQGGNLLYQRVGYDSDQQEWSPGTVLLFLVLESAFADPSLTAFDFTEGEGSHKEFFANRDALCADIHYFRRTPKLIVLAGLHAALASLSRGIAWATDQLGVKAWLKKRIRARA